MRLECVLQSSAQLLRLQCQCAVVGCACRAPSVTCEVPADGATANLSFSSIGTGITSLSNDARLSAAVPRLPRAPIWTRPEKPAAPEAADEPPSPKTLMMGRFMKGGRVAPFKPGDQEPDPDREILDNLRKRRWLLPPIESHCATAGGSGGSCCCSSPVTSRSTLHCSSRSSYLARAASCECRSRSSSSRCAAPPQHTQKTLLSLHSLTRASLVCVCAVGDRHVLSHRHYTPTPHDDIRTRRGGALSSSLTRASSRGYTHFPYLHRGRFLWDLISCIPIDLIGLVPGLLPGGIYGVYAMWLRANRLIHGLRVISVHGGQIAKLTRPREDLYMECCGSSSRILPHAVIGL